MLVGFLPGHGLRTWKGLSFHSKNKLVPLFPRFFLWWFEIGRDMFSPVIGVIEG